MQDCNRDRRHPERLRTAQNDPCTIPGLVTGEDQAGVRQGTHRVLEGLHKRASAQPRRRDQQQLRCCHAGRNVRHRSTEPPPLWLWDDTGCV